ncbi:MAG: glycogen synthase [Oscillospiraceae bacterium]|nr:glycogen synthase [Oscillospiraceae bacterium]
MKVLFITGEVNPFSQTGGLADVSASLPKALARKKISIRVMSPLYGSIDAEWRAKMRFVKYIYVQLAWRSAYCGLFELKKDGVTYYFIDNEYYFKRGEMYGYFDECERFAFFSRAASALLCELDGWQPSVVHCNDWQTALVPVYMRKIYGGMPEYDAMKTVLTIHNIAYQGHYGKDVLGSVLGLGDDLICNGGIIEYNGGINLMKAGINLSDWVTTVSPTYAQELQHWSFYGCGLEGVLAANSDKFSGILNGIDPDSFDPEALVNPFSSKDLKGKVACKAELQKLLGLGPDPKVPLITMVGRLVDHKGMDLVAAALDEIMAQDVQLAILGRGDWHYEQMFSEVAHRYNGRCSASMLYNPALAQSMYAGGDIFLMPSRTEPCGLAQMIAMRYGNVPIVRRTGGLCDTVIPYPQSDSLGFVFDNCDSWDMLEAIRTALSVYRNKPKEWKALMSRGTDTDFSWADSAKAYIKLYKAISP